jgi:hypothetical protein
MIKSLQSDEKLKCLSKRTGIGAPVDHKIKRREENGVVESKQEKGWTWKENERKDKKLVMFFKERINVTG